jgi:diguanylate cyclase (GGDEF) domain
LTSDEHKTGFLKDLAEDNGAAIIVVNETGAEVAAFNNNSMCQHLYSSPEFAPKCDEYCGRAFAVATEAGKPVPYRCYAGLDCRAVPLGSKKPRFVAIVGRAFTRTDNYRAATERVISGDWRSFPPTRIFENVIISASSNQLDALEQQVGKLTRDQVAEFVKEAEDTAAQDVEAPIEAIPIPNEPIPDPFQSSLLNYNLDTTPVEGESRPDPFASSLMNYKTEPTPSVHNYDVTDREAWQSFILTLLEVPYKLACRRILEFLSRHYGIESSIWLQPEGKEFETAAATGEFEHSPVRIGIATDDRRIRAAVRDDSPIMLKERQAESTKNRRLIQFFPVVIGGRVWNALGVAREKMDPELSSRVSKFCRYVAARLEILRLREAVAERERVSRRLREFNEQLRNIDAENFWQKLTSVSADLVGAERASLLVRGPTEALTAKAYIGARVDLSFAGDLGERVARTILDKGKPVLVTDVARISLPPAPDERKYKTASFISYPITIGDRGIAVLNFTDKIGGQLFNKRDMETLDSIAPQIGVAVDRMAFRDKAGEYAQLSVTDPLTGLLNRRYIEERLTEEIKRSNRNGEPVSFMMLDVDEFKAYNDRFGHPAGDEALSLIAQILKESLRGADVAARYGGEEFSILLPQTTSDEAETIAERLRQQVETTNFPKRKVTVSIGIASRSSTINSVPELIAAADKALYQAKRGGRNNVQTYVNQGDGADENIH